MGESTVGVSGLAGGHGLWRGFTCGARRSHELVDWPGDASSDGASASASLTLRSRRPVGDARLNSSLAVWSRVVSYPPGLAVLLGFM